MPLAGKPKKGLKDHICSAEKRPLKQLYKVKQTDYNHATSKCNPVARNVICDYKDVRNYHKLYVLTMKSEAAKIQLQKGRIDCQQDDVKKVS